MTSPTTGQVTRVYAPATASGLLAMVTSGRLPATGAFAVTHRLRSMLAIPGDDPAVEDELAEAAVVAAADACLALMAVEGVVGRRVVVAADVPAVPDTDPDSHPAAVVCPAGIALPALACLLADDPADEVASAAVALAVAAHSGTDADLDTALDALDDFALAWFDASELPHFARPGGLT